MPRTICAVTSTGAFLPGHDGRGDDHVVFRDYFSHEFALAGVEGFVLRRGVSARILRILGLDGQFDEASAEALHLFLHGGPHIVGRNDRAQTTRGGDCLQTRHADADDQDARRV